MRRRHERLRSVRAALAVAARRALVFALAFCLAFWAELAFVPDARADAGSQDPDSATKAPAIEDLSIYTVGSDNAWAGPIADAIQFARNGTTGAAAIEDRAGTLTFGSRVWWDDDSFNDNYYLVEWSLASGSDIAKLSEGGQLSALGTGNGTAVVQARVPGADTTTGDDLVAQVEVAIRGQEGTPYVSAIRICDGEGNPIDSWTLSGDLATAHATFTAQATVTDPATGTQTTYLSTPTSGLSAQTAGAIPDLSWQVNDTALASVDAASGMYRPLVAATDELRCISNAGQDGSRVMATIAVVMEGTQEQQDGYFPQDNLRVYVTYESDASTIVADKTFDVDEVKALGSETVTYTSIQGAASASGPGFFTVTGYGPYLSTLLAAVGVNDTSSVLAFDVQSYDSPDYISGALLFDSDRWYYPNYDMGSYAERQASPPMIAVEASRAPTGSSEPSYDFNDGNRFYLLYGAKSDGSNNAQHQRKWVNAIHVILKGAPPAQDVNPDEPNNPSPDAPSSGAGGAGNDGGAGLAGGAGADGGASEGGASDASGNEGGNAGDEGGAGGAATTTDAATAAADGAGDSGAGGGASQVGGSPASRWSIYQMASPYTDNDVATILKDNPVAPFVVPCAAGVLAAGFVEHCLGYRAQRRRPKGLTWS